ncbi:MAG: MEDS domain-containing protein [Bacteroidia bacterium]
MPNQNLSVESGSRHQCLIYEGSPSQKLPFLASVIQQKIQEGYRCLYLNSAPMVAGVRSTLAALGTDVEAELSEERLILSSESSIVDGEFKILIMLKKLEEALDKALADGHKGLWASGDMTWEFGPGKDFSKLLQYELELEKFFHKRKELSGICQYHKDTLPAEALRRGLFAHQTVIVNNTLTKVNPYYLKSPILTETNDQLDQMISVLRGA